MLKIKSPKIQFKDPKENLQVLANILILKYKLPLTINFKLIIPGFNLTENQKDKISNFIEIMNLIHAPHKLMTINQILSKILIDSLEISTVTQKNIHHLILIIKKIPKNSKNQNLS